MRIKAEEEIIKKIDGIIVSTELEQNDLINAYDADKNQISIIHPGVNHHIFKKYQKQRSRQKFFLPINRNIITFVGRIDPVKGINLLLKAVSHLLKLHPQLSHKFSLLLIGGNIKDRNFWIDPEVQFFRKYIKSNKLEGYVRFIGSQPYHMLPYYYSASDIVVLPSIYETFGLVIIEAMACGSCVIASRVGGLKCLVKDKSNGRLFRRGDYIHLADIIWELLMDKKQRIRLGRNAEIFSQKYCWDKQARKMVKAYKKYI
jgi:D-inositol-3-phosphate glycosyltransferase